MEKTFVMVKPDGIKRGLVGEVIATFERSGLKLAAIKMLQPERGLVEKHYPSADQWLGGVGQHTVDGCAELGMDVIKEFGTADPIEIGKMVKVWLVDFITSGPVVAMIWEGPLAVSNVRRLCGNTLPNKAEAGSIRGKYGLDSAVLANAEKRPVFNLVHASGNVEEAKTEINLWFPELA
ncbi:MAG: nucleoside-diphosphate kinase [Patescibacteria group bacterium]